MTLEVVTTIYPSNFRDVAATLRAIADEVEAGKYGEVGCCGVVLLGDRMEVFAMGPDSGAPSGALLLHAGFASMSRAVEDHGKS
jgi:hypothetical protein